MPTFAFNATDSMGNTVEGRLDADDLTVAANQVRNMGYTPLRVEAAVEPAPVVRSLLQPDVPARPMAPTAPMAHDLSQSFAEPLGAPVIGGAMLLNAEAPVVEEGHLEPWQRGGTLPEAVTTPPPPTTTVTSLLQPTAQSAVAYVATAPPLPSVMTPQLQREGVAIPYVKGVKRQVSLWQRFLHMIVYPIFSGVVIKDLAPWLRQFATLINAGLPMYQALAALESNTPNAKLKEITRQGQKQVQAGGTFSDVMEAYPWIFQPVQIEMVRAAELGGLLDVTLRQLAEYVEHEIEIRRLINRETLYPKITLFMAFMILGRPAMIGGSIPAVSSLVLGTMGKATYTFANYLADTIGFGAQVFLPIIGIAILCRLFLFNISAIREAYDTVKMMVPYTGRIVRMYAMAKFGRTFAALYRGGFAMGSALEIAGNACGNAVLRRAAHRAIPAAERGMLASDALLREGAFENMAIDLFRTGETSGNLDQMCDRMAEFYEGEAKAKSHVAALIFGTFVFLIVAILVGKSVIEFWSGSASSTAAAANAASTE